MTLRCAALVALLAIGLGCGEDPGPEPVRAGRPQPTPHVEVPAVPRAIVHPAPVRAERPFNLVLISIDTLRADHLSAYGYARPTSPRIDALAADGTLFEQAYSHSPKTVPSHMTLVTSLPPEVHRVLNRAGREIDSKLSTEIPTLPEILEAGGYRSAAFTAGGNMNGGIGFARGFERFEHLPVDAAPTFEAGIETVRDWAAEASEAPFLLLLHTVQVHDPYLPPESHRDLFARPDYAGRIRSSRAELAARAKESGRSIAAEFWRDVDLESEADVQHLRDLYDACIRYTDDQIGRLVDTLAELGRLEDTAIILLSDHGEEFLEHGGTRHNSLFEELLHVPLIVRLPDAYGVEPGRRVQAPVRLVDVMPTVLDLVGLPLPDHLTGSSLLPLIDGTPEPPRYVFAHWRERGARSLRAGRYKLIRIPGNQHVFDLLRDPGERRPIEKIRPDLVASLGGDLKRLMETASATAELVAPGAPEPIDAKTREELRALGYLE